MTAGQQNLSQPLIFKPILKEFIAGGVEVDMLLTSPVQTPWGLGSAGRLELIWRVPDVPRAIGAVDFILFASADLEDPDKLATLTFNGVKLGDFFLSASGLTCPDPPQQQGFSMGADQFNSLLDLFNGQLNVVVGPSATGGSTLPQSGICLLFGRQSTMQVTIAYRATQQVGDPDQVSYIGWQVYHDTIVNNFDDFGVKHRNLEIELLYDPHSNGLVTEILDELGKTTIGGCEGVVIIDEDGDEMTVTTFATTAEIGGEVWTFSHSAACILVPGG